MGATAGQPGQPGLPGEGVVGGAGGAGGAGGEGKESGGTGGEGGRGGPSPNSSGASRSITPAVIIIGLMLLINAGATLALWSSADTAADTANKSAAAALKVARNNEKLINLRVDQTCLVEEKQHNLAPSYCNEPGVGLPEK